jgi:hypothetical protein
MYAIYYGKTYINHYKTERGVRIAFGKFTKKVIKDCTALNISIPTLSWKVIPSEDEIKTQLKSLLITATIAKNSYRTAKFLDFAEHMVSPERVREDRHLTGLSVEIDELDFLLKNIYGWNYKKLCDFSNPITTKAYKEWKVQNG